MSKIVKRTLDFIEVFAEYGRPLSLTELSKILKIPASSCHDVLQSLQERGYVYEIAPRRGFYPTLKLQELASRIIANDPVLTRSEIKLREFRDTYDESVLLSRIDKASATYLMVMEPSYPLRFLRRVGDSATASHTTSVGKAILGSMPEPQRRKAIDKLDMAQVTENSITDRDTLWAEIEESRARGWYVSREEQTLTVLTISTTFTWLRSTFVVTVAGPTFRLAAKEDALVKGLLAAAQELGDPGLE